MTKNKIIEFFKFIGFLEKEKINSMIDCGRGFY